MAAPPVKTGESQDFLFSSRQAVSFYIVTGDSPTGATEGLNRLGLLKARQYAPQPDEGTWWFQEEDMPRTASCSYFTDVKSKFQKQRLWLTMYYNIQHPKEPEASLKAPPNN